MSGQRDTTLANLAGAMTFWDAHGSLMGFLGTQRKTSGFSTQG